MRTVEKHTLMITKQQWMDTYAGGQPMCATTTEGLLTLWMAVDTDRPTVDRVVHLVCDAGELPETDDQYVGTCTLGRHVWHVFLGPERD